MQEAEELKETQMGRDNQNNQNNNNNNLEEMVRQSLEKQQLVSPQRQPQVRRVKRNTWTVPAGCFYFSLFF